VLPKIDEAVNHAADNFKADVLPNVQKLTRSVIDWGKKVGENG